MVAISNAASSSCRSKRWYAPACAGATASAGVVGTSPIAAEAGSSRAEVTRRAVNIASSLLPAMATGDPAGASRLGPATDAVWERMGGGPADLYFPKEFEGVWQVDSTLLTMDEPLGAEMVRDREVAERAAREDLQKTITYPVKFTLNSQGRVVLDRRFNTAALLEHYYGSSFSFGSRIVWDIDDPNQLRIQLPAGRSVSTRVTRRLLEKPASDRIDTSEYFQQVFESQDPGVQPKVTASQCFTKYRFRSQTAAAGGAQIVATQVVSDFLTSYDDQKKFMDAKGRPVLVYTYRLAFSRSSA